ncbi:MAG: accessory gene regulator B family protein [Eubacteriales bacterium]|nr:accessory gene regulator B family protein [Eubacteriales bacterium]
MEKINMKQEEIKYGMIQGIYSISGIVIILLLGGLLGVLPETIVFLANVVLLCMYAGGGHGPVRGRCAAAALLAAAGALGMIKYVKLDTAASLAAGLVEAGLLYYFMAAERTEESDASEQAIYRERGSRVLVLEILLFVITINILGEAFIAAFFVALVFLLCENGKGNSTQKRGIQEGKAFGVRNNRKVYILLQIIFVIAVIGICLGIERERVIAYEWNDHFFPRADLAAAYEAFPDSKRSISIQSTENADLEYLRKCRIAGTAYQEPSSEFILGFDMYEGEQLNEKWGVLSDTGQVIPGSELPNETRIRFFDFLALEYHGADLWNERLIIQNDSEDAAFGCVRTVYVSASGKIKSDCIPLESSAVPVDTKKGTYFLKQMYIFSAYDQETYALQDKVLYQIKKDKDTTAEFTLQRANR